MIYYIRLNELEQKVFDEFTKYYETLEVAVDDPMYRIKLAEKMINSRYQPFEYYGDKYLTMEDFWSSLSDADRLTLLGNFMNGNYVHNHYGKYREMFLSLMTVLRQSKESLPQEEKLLEGMLSGEKSKSPSYLG